MGQHLLSLDVGLPTDELRTVIREVACGERERVELSLQAIDRGGRSVSLRVAVTTLAGLGPERGDNDGARLLMEEVPRTVPTAAEG